MSTRRCAATLFFLLLGCAFAQANPQDPVKKAEFEQKRAELKAKAERRRAEMKAEFERRKAEQKNTPSATKVTSRPPSESKATIAASSFDAKTKMFRCPEGQFTVVMREDPRMQEMKASGVTMKMFTIQDRDGAYAVAFADLPIPANEAAGKTQERLDGARNGMLQNVKGKLTSETPVMLQGRYPGREIRADIPSMSGMVRARIYLVGPRLYQVAAIGVPSWVNSEEASKFLGSLAYTSKDQ